MISQLNGAAISSTYNNNLNNEAKTSTQKTGATATVTKQGDTSKIEQIKEALESGEYKINLQALSEKIAEELL